jgi:hypothetical protein
MPKFSTTQTFADGDQVTSAKMNAIVSGLSADSDLASDSTLTVAAGALKVGVIGATNIAANAVTTAKITDSAITAAKLATDSVETAKIKDLNVTGAKIADATLGYSKTLAADRAGQTEMQSQDASHFVSPDVLKYHPGVAKAYGVVAWQTGVTTITGGYNTTGAIDTGSGREITLAVTMANTNYVVVANLSDTGQTVTVSGKTTTKFTLDTTTNAEGAGRVCNFTVFGQLA